ncbi:hypothetical protein [Alienimonas chondri]|uniref:PH domain-containing protein n=1 Tax=Alienimonas chondri TaxID=2681879 RepID=A0ABX1VJN9_9PLAN|nr:hypothetical protein [Alienimonas chondri]NNJ27473.1 hypothetical protein [Alienimonas chondri]
MADAPRCESCDAVLRLLPADRRRGFAACSECGECTDLPEAPAEQGAEAPPAPPTRPERWTVEHGDGVVAVRWAWRSAKSVALALFTLLWFGFLALFALILWVCGVPSGPEVQGPGELASEAMFVVLPLVILAVGAVMGYVALAGLRNQTILTAGHGQFRTRHEPIWWWGGQTIAMTDFDRLRSTATDAGFAVSGPDLVETVYAVEALGDGRRETLVRGIRGENAARFLAKTLGEALELPDEEPMD